MMQQKARWKYLDHLIEQGYGKDRDEVSMYLIDRELDDLLRARVLTNKPDSKVEVSK